MDLERKCHCSYMSVQWKKIHSFFFEIYFISEGERERESAWTFAYEQGEGQRERERQSQAVSLLSREPDTGLHPRTLRS